MTDFDDYDKTIIKPVASLAAGPAEVAAQETGAALPVGARLGEFQITGLIGAGAFGNVYLAQDYSLGRNVALKEYMPAALAMRVDSVSVAPRSGRHADAFAAGLISFINEARLLARFDHPSLVKVHRFWEANGTAYMAMPFYEGQTLAKTLAGMGKPPSEQWLKDLLAPLLDALQVIHSEDGLHGDIAPDNIVLLKEGRPVLLEFGSARRAVMDSSKTPGASLKQGYAPLEQYAKDSAVSQGAWTDLYALAAVARFAITGQVPAPSVDRVVSDTLVPLAQSAKGRYSDGFLRAIDRSLSLDPEKRPQSAQEMKELLGLAPPAANTNRPDGAQAATPPRSATRGRLLWAGLALGCLAVGVSAFLLLSGSDTTQPSPLPAAEAVRSDMTPAPSAAAQPPSAVVPDSASPTQAAASQPDLTAQQRPATDASSAPLPGADASSNPALSPPATNAKAAATAATGVPRTTTPRPKTAVAGPASAPKAPVQAEAEPHPPVPAAPPVAVAEKPAAPEAPKVPVRTGPSPIDSCGKDRAFLSSCVRDRCKWQEFASHPVCVEARAKGN